MLENYLAIAIAGVGIIIGIGILPFSYWLREKIERFKHRQKYYICKTCGWEVLKTEAKISGHADDSTYGLHVHCGNCGLIIETHI